MKLLIVSDAWWPQTNGVVKTLSMMQEGLHLRGWQVEVLGPSGLTVPCPSYPEIRLSLLSTRMVYNAIESFEPDAIHVATEGPLGRAARYFCLEFDLPFTTSFHTRFPEYVNLRFRIPKSWSYWYLRRFHNSAQKVLVPSRSMQNELIEQGFKNVKLWGRGVDTERFHPCKRIHLDFPRPIQLYVGRVSVEKNIEAFLTSQTQGTKLVVGDGPYLETLRTKFSEAVFLGKKVGEELAQIYASSDVFVFPSLTDTFGLVQLEALASGLPVAAFRATGSQDVITSRKVGVLAEGGDLKLAIEQALQLKSADCREYALQHSWQRSIDQFESALAL